MHNILFVPTAVISSSFLIRSNGFLIVGAKSKKLSYKSQSALNKCWCHLIQKYIIDQYALRPYCYYLRYVDYLVLLNDNFKWIALTHVFSLISVTLISKLLALLNAICIFFQCLYFVHTNMCTLHTKKLRRKKPPLHI